MNPDKLLSDVCSIAKECGQFLMTENKKIKPADVETKSEHDYVTWVDKASEKFLMAELGKLLPEAAFVAEESALVLIHVKMAVTIPAEKALLQDGLS